MTMKMSQTGLALTMASEGVRLTAYLDSGGIPTIGYGHTSGVKAGMTCTQAQAEQWLAEDVEGSEYVVNKVVTAPLNQNQFDALVDFVFNLGSGAFQGSTLLKLLNQGDYACASKEFPKWNHGRINGVLTEIAGLTTRRLAEQKLFDTPVTMPVSPTPTVANTETPTLTAQLQSWFNKLTGK